MARKKGSKERATKAKKKKFSAPEKKSYVLDHLGTMTYEKMAQHLECSEDNIYLILRQIREDRDGTLINKDIVQVSAEEQFNRLNTQAKLSFSNLMKEYQTVQQGGPDAKIYMYTRIYNEAERSLTQFLKAVGLYQQDININTGDTDNSITVVFAPGMQDTVDKKVKKTREVNPK